MAPKKKLDSKDKVLADLKSREDERQTRENEIMKLSLMNKTSFIGFEEGAAVVEKHLRKMIRKCLMLTIDA